MQNQEESRQKELFRRLQSEQQTLQEKLQQLRILKRQIGRKKQFGSPKKVPLETLRQEYRALCDNVVHIKRTIADIHRKIDKNVDTK
jgi:hypothetical protein